MYRAAMSIPANIAEGRRQKGDKQFARFLGYALNSSSELEHHLIVARDTKAIGEADFISLVSQTITVRKMLYGLVKKLENDKPDSTSKRSVPHLSSKPPAGPPTAPGR